MPASRFNCPTMFNLNHIGNIHRPKDINTMHPNPKNTIHFDKVAIFDIFTSPLFSSLSVHDIHHHPLLGNKQIADATFP